MGRLQHQGRETDDSELVRRLTEENRNLRLKSREESGESENRSLFEAKLGQQKLQFELQRACARVLHLKAKVEKGRGPAAVPGREVKLLEDELRTIRNAYEMAISYIAANGEKLLQAQLESEMLAVQLKAAREMIADSDFDVDGELLEDLKRKTAAKAEVEGENAWLKSAITEIHRDLTGVRSDRGSDIRSLLSDIKAHIGRVRR
jgi:hypothetical protein